MLVIDASAALEWVFTDEATAESDRLFERVAREGAMVPAIFHAELANVLLQAERRKRISRDYSTERLGVIAALRLTTNLDTIVRASRETLVLARQEGLTVYDASYLELAMRLAAELASRDQELLAAARRNGVALAL
ncbi:MAG TPA: type II toxin-antitoxin system VapC family toxin [Devosia sp.]|jgi:predicted nucleic acid-binding protein|nr:type II toxin-antitoxin system VapC family toxin [Devosia sp.]